MEQNIFTIFALLLSTPNKQLFDKFEEIRLNLKTENFISHYDLQCIIDFMALLRYTDQEKLKNDYIVFSEIKLKDVIEKNQTYANQPFYNSSVLNFNIPQYFNQLSSLPFEKAFKTHSIYQSLFPNLMIKLQEKKCIYDQFFKIFTK